MKGIAIFLLLGGMAWTQEQPKHDGNLWRILPPEAKMGYVTGYYDASCFDAVQAALAMKPPLSEQEMKKAPGCSFPNRGTYRQMIKGIDRFYQNASNRPITTVYAWNYVEAQMAGTPLPEENLKAMRLSVATATPSPQPSAR